MKVINFSPVLALMTVSLVLISEPTQADTYTVTNTNDSGTGSLRQAMTDANSHAGADTIVFNILTSDPGYNASTGVWTIQPASALPDLTDDSTTIDGTTQTANQGNTNPNGPEIEIDGTNAGEASGFTIYGANNVIKGLVINRFTQFGIIITGSSANSNVVSGNYIGTDASGTIDMGNAFSGVIMYTGSQDNTIGGTTTAERNIISGNDWSGVEIQGSGAENNVVIGNYIGTDVTGSEDLGNYHYGVHIWSYAKGNTVGGTTTEERNIISGNDWTGVGIGRSDSNRVSGNYIGTRASGTEDLGNSTNGVAIHTNAQGNTIGPGNLITNNRDRGVVVRDSDATGNTITQNSITNNSGLGIDNTDGGNTELTPPTITTVTYTFVSGTAPPNSTVEIFSDPEDEGGTYEGTTVADGDGNFSWTGSLTGPNVTATATDATGNTSEFSTAVVVPVELVNFSASCHHGAVILEWTTVTESNNYGFEVERSGELKAQSNEQSKGSRDWKQIGFVPGHGTTTVPHSYSFTDKDATQGTYYYRLKQIDTDGSFEYSPEIGVKLELPESYTLEQNYPNPFNPVTTIRFAVAKSNRVILKVFSVSGKEVKTLVDENYRPGYYRVNFDASDLVSGIYFYRIQIGDFTNTKKMLLIK